jgi:hypothetical protein
MIVRILDKSHAIQFDDNCLELVYYGREIARIQKGGTIIVSTDEIHIDYIRELITEFDKCILFTEED